MEPLVPSKLALKFLDKNSLKCQNREKYLCSNDEVSCHKCEEADNMKIMIKEEMKPKEHCELLGEDSEMMPLIKEEVTFAVVMDEWHTESSTDPLNFFTENNEAFEENRNVGSEEMEDTELKVKDSEMMPSVNEEVTYASVIETSDVLNERDKQCEDEGNNQSTGNLKNLRQFQCSTCSYSSRSKGQLARHIKRVHEKVKPFHCSKCAFCFASKSQLVRHVKRVHEKVKQFQCSKCTFRSAYKYSVDLHLKGNHENKKEVICTECPYRACSEFQLWRHLLDVHEINKYQCSMSTSDAKSRVKIIKEEKKQFECPKCPFQSKYKINLTEHLKEAHENEKILSLAKDSEVMPFVKKEVKDAAVSDDGSSIASTESSLLLKESYGSIGDNLNKQSDFRTGTGNLKNVKEIHCSECSYKTHLESQLWRHLRVVHEMAQQYRCHMCSYRSPYLQGLSQHIKEVHENVKEFHCAECPYMTYSERQLWLHLKLVHEKTNAYRCSMCPYTIGYKSHLARHIRRVHEKVKPFQCSKCTFQSAYKYSLDMHLKAVHENNVFQCSKCPFSSGYQCSLDRHVKAVHESEELFQCLKCPFHSCYKGIFTKHLRMAHENVKQYHCSKCTFQAAYKHGLTEHLNEFHKKLYQCSQCAFQAAYRRSLVEHLKIVHNNLKFKCSKCAFISATRRLLTKHIKTVH